MATMITYTNDFEIKSISDLEEVLSPDGGIFASAGILFKDAVFGRDSIESAEDLLEPEPSLAAGVIKNLARLQGIEHNSISEEEPGKIHHEHRRLMIGDRKVSSESEAILLHLAERWGGSKDEMTYYGTVDATPLYARLVVDYCAHYGQAVLEERYQSKSGKTLTIKDSLAAALNWIVRKIEASDIDLVEFRRTNSQGIEYQTWKDSQTSYVHTSGELANTKAPIAPIEVQAVAYDALIGGSELMAYDDEQAAKWHTAAEKLQQDVIGYFWMSEKGYFAMGIDRDQAGNPRRIETISSNPGLLLDTRIFDGLPKRDVRQYIEAIVQTIYSPEFLTDAGIRCRSLRYENLIDFQDYHGTWAVWVKETYDIAKGLRRQGFVRLAEQLENRILNAVTIAGSHLEFFYVDPGGRVNYYPKLQEDDPLGIPVIIGTNIPEDNQAWTITAVLAIRRQRGFNKEVINTGQTSDLEVRLLRQNPQITVLTEKPAVDPEFLKLHSFAIDTKAGIDKANLLLKQVHSLN